MGPNLRQAVMTSSVTSLVLPTHHVFVYGTLCRGELRDINLLRPGPVFIGRGTVRGLLYDLGHYPGVLLQEDGDETALVYGEVYAIKPELEQILDEIEEVWPQKTGEYTKREAVAQLCRVGTDFDKSGFDGLEKVRCFLYEINVFSTFGKPSIAGGDWVSYRRALRQ